MTLEKEKKLQALDIENEQQYYNGNSVANKEKEKEQGCAEINIKLENSIILVQHSEGQVVLAKFKASKGDWDSICNTINNLVKKNQGYRLGV